MTIRIICVPITPFHPHLLHHPGQHLRVGGCIWGRGWVPESDIFQIPDRRSHDVQPGVQLLCLRRLGDTWQVVSGRETKGSEFHSRTIWSRVGWGMVGRMGGVGRVGGAGRVDRVG